jgi:putative transcriptional regulator
MLGVRKFMLKCNLKDILDQRGMKQTFLANKMEVSKQTMNGWIKGKSAPNLDTAFKLADELGCSITDIWEYQKEE